MAIVAALVSCTKKEEVPVQQGRDLRIEVSTEQTKVSYAFGEGKLVVGWENGDKLVLCDQTGHQEEFVIDNSTISADKKTAVFAKAGSTLAEGPIYVRQNVNSSDNTRHMRQQNHSWGLKSYVPMSGEAVLADDVLGGAALDYDCAVLRITATNFGAGVNGTITDVVLDSPNISNIIRYNKGDKTFLLHDSVQEIQVNTVNAAVVDGVQQKDIFVAFAPQRSSSAENYTLVFKIDGKSYIYEWQATRKYEPGVVYTLKEKEVLPPAVDPATAIVFEDATVKGIVVTAFDTNSDGELSYAEAAAVTTWPSPSPFRDATAAGTKFNELQYFTGLSQFSWAAFRSSSIESVTLPKNLAKISDTMFQQSQIVSVVVPSGVTEIEQCAFNYCPKLATVVLPATVTKIGHWAFRNCYAITSFKLLATVPPARADNTEFLNTSHKIYVPVASVEAYKTAWPDLASRIAAIE